MMRRNVITHRAAQEMLAVMALAAVTAVVASGRPTGGTWFDHVLCAALAAFVVWAAATTPWWMLAGAGGIAALLAPNLVTTVVGLAAAGAAMWVGARKESRVAVRCASGALTVQVLLRLDLGGFFGSSALVAFVVFGAVVGFGVHRRHREVRRRVIVGAIAVGGIAVLCSIGFAIGAVQSRSELSGGYNDLLAGLDYLQSGRVEEAGAKLRTSADKLGAASDRFDAPWVAPARLVPVVAQHAEVMRDVVGEASRAARSAADALALVDLEQLTVVDGTIDLAAVEMLAHPLAQLEIAVVELRATLDAADSGWLLDPVQTRLRRYQARAEQADAQARAASAAATTGPAMLGRDGLRRYLVMFTSPAEARGLSGVMGNYAVVTIDRGRIRRTGFGRTNDLQVGIIQHPDTRIDAPAEFFTRYGEYGAADPGSPPRPKFWSNVTMSPDMPTVGSVVAQMYEGAMGERLDGVFVLDPKGLAALLDVTGPITLDGLDTPLDGTSLEQFLLRDIYEYDENVREDLLQQASELTIDALLTTTLPAPQSIAATLGPATTTSHIVGWARRPEEEHVFRLMGMDGRLPELDGRDGLAVVNDNGNGNKIDSFLEREVIYRASYDSGTGQVTGTVEVVLRNTAPTTGYPDYVIGNLLGLPTGTNRTLLSIYTPLDVSGATLDGEAVGTSHQTEVGWNVSSMFVVIPPGEERRVTLSLTGRIDPGGYTLVLRPQPLAHPERVTVRVTGDADVRYEGALTRRSVIDGSELRALR
jgi:hypothetical protein